MILTVGMGESWELKARKAVEAPERQVPFLALLCSGRSRLANYVFLFSLEWRHRLVTACYGLVSVQLMDL